MAGGATYWCDQRSAASLEVPVLGQVLAQRQFGDNFPKSYRKHLALPLAPEKDVKGFVETPLAIVDEMVAKLFDRRPPKEGDALLDPGCGTGAFIAGVLRWCERHGAPTPRILGVDSDPKHVAVCRLQYATNAQIEIRLADFLTSEFESFDYVVGNPPYVPITGLSEDERGAYRSRYASARGRFDLYLLFFERALQLLNDAGRLVFITPEKYLYVQTAAPLRELLSGVSIDELHFVDESTFGHLVTYPLITTVTRRQRKQATRVVHRDGSRTVTALRPDAASWLAEARGVTAADPGDWTLEDICRRISCGVATGADSVFVRPFAQVDSSLRPFCYPTISGRQITSSRDLAPTDAMLTPYDDAGRLLSEQQLGGLRQHLAEPTRMGRLLARTCVRAKPWYAFHESPPLLDILRPKLLCKDIGADPFFVIDRGGTIVPRHSVYYLVPSDSGQLDQIATYLNSEDARSWLRNHCQRAANGFLRLQSHVLKRVPVPGYLVGASTRRARQLDAMTGLSA